MPSPLIVDLYALDLNGKPNLGGLVAAGAPWHGVVLKATEGVGYDGGAWFQSYWPQARDLAGDRYGVDWFRGAYHYVRFNQSPDKQLDLYLTTIERAGGWGAGDLWPVLDVEHANNTGASAAQIIDCVTRIADGLQLRLGREVTLYGGSLLYDNQITDHMGCARLWTARYAATLPAVVYERIGWQLEDLLMWQYCGDGEAYLANYPAMSPIGKTDISAVTIAGGGDAALAYLREHLCAATPTT